MVRARADGSDNGERDSAGRTAIQVIDRLVSLLDALAEQPEAVSLKELSLRTGLHPSTAHRILNDLVSARLVDRSEPGTYQLGTRPGSMSQNAQGDLEQFGQAVQRRFARVAYTEQTRFNPGTKIHHLAEEPKLNAVGPQRRVNQAMIKAKMMESSATTRSVPDVNNQVQKIVAERNAVSAQRRNIQIAADLEREATSLEQQAIRLANKGFQIPDKIPEIQVAVGSSNTMNTAMILGALALGVIAATMWAKR